MVVQCPQCRAQYNYAEERFGDRAAKRLRCFRCATVFDVSRPVPAEDLSSDDRRPEPPAPEVDPPLSGASEQQAPPEELLEITLRSREREHADEAHDEPPPPTKKRRRTVAPPPPEPVIDPAVVKADGPPKLPAGYRLSLAVINGPDSGKLFRIDKPRIVIGRASGDFTLSDSETSKRHAAIEIHDSTILLEDLGSTNGTFHKGKAIAAPMPLHNHSEFKVGNTTLMLIVTREG